MLWETPGKKSVCNRLEKKSKHDAAKCIHINAFRKKECRENLQKNSKPQTIDVSQEEPQSLDKKREGRVEGSLTGPRSLVQTVVPPTGGEVEAREKAHGLWGEGWEGKY